MRKNTTAIILFLFFIMLGCSYNQEEGLIYEKPKNLEPDITVFEVTWKEETIILDNETVSQLMIDYNPVSNLIQFTNDSILEGISPGDHLLLENIGLFEVEEIYESENITFQVKDGSLVNAAHEGNVEWDIGIVGAERGQVEIIDVDADPDWLIYASSSNAVDFSGKFGGFDVDFKITSSTSSTEMSLSAEASGSNNNKVYLGAQGRIKNFRNKGVFNFSNNTIDKFQLSLDDLEIEIEIDISANELAFDNSISIPVGLSFPFYLGPIPMYISINGVFSPQSNLRLEGEGSISGSSKIRGNLIIKREEGGSFKIVETPSVGESNIKTSNQSGVIATAGVGVMFDFPQIHIGAGIHKKVSGSLFVGFKAEVLSNLLIRTNLFTAEQQYCLNAICSVGIGVGGEINLFGVSLTREIILFSEKDEKKSGPDCDKF